MAIADGSVSGPSRPGRDRIPSAWLRNILSKKYPAAGELVMCRWDRQQLAQPTTGLAAGSGPSVTRLHLHPGPARHMKKHTSYSRVISTNHYKQQNATKRQQKHGLRYLSHRCTARQSDTSACSNRLFVRGHTNTVYDGGSETKLAGFLVAKHRLAVVEQQALVSGATAAAF